MAQEPDPHVRQVVHGTFVDSASTIPPIIFQRGTRTLAKDSNNNRQRQLLETEDLWATVAQGEDADGRGGVLKVC